MANPYYLCAYGHVIRVSDRVNSEEAATLNTFGIRKLGSLPTRVTVLKVTGKGWAYRSEKDKRGNMLYLARMHYKRTENVAGGFTEEELKPTNGNDNKKRPLG